MNDPNALLADARQGNQEALGRLLEMYRPYLKTISRLKLSPSLQSRLDGSDLVQETALRAQRSINDFQGDTEEEFTAWLRRIMANVAASAGRYHGAQRRDIALERQLHESFDGSSRILEQALVNPGTSPSENTRRRERAVILAEVLEQLPRDYREVVMLRQFEGLSLTEAARRMGAPAAVCRNSGSELSWKSII